jgi:hypothetical protein
MQPSVKAKAKEANKRAMPAEPMQPSEQDKQKDAAKHEIEA